MKAIALFMTFLMIVTGFELCNDSENGICNGDTEYSQIPTDTHKEESPCTPFCNCARCPFSIVVTEADVVLLKSSKPTIQFAIASVQATNAIITFIWQPPQVF